MEKTDIHSIPKGPFFGRPATHWTWDYEREEWVKVAHLSPFGESDVLYEFNDWGYRGASFAERSEINILAVGCSCTFGTGLPYDTIFHQVLARMIREKSGRSVTVWNMGIPGASNDLIARHILDIVPLLDPSIVVASFTFIARREYYSALDSRYDYLPTVSPDWNRSLIPTWKIFQRLASSHDDSANLTRNIKAAHSILHNRPWIMTGAHNQVREPIVGLFPHLYAGNLEFTSDEPAHEKARDLVHPGVNNHKKLAAACFDRLNTLGYLTS